MTPQTSDEITAARFAEWREALRPVGAAPILVLAINPRTPRIWHIGVPESEGLDRAQIRRLLLDAAATLADPPSVRETRAPRDRRRRS
jgi:hypothetical protein